MAKPPINRDEFLRALGRLIVNANHLEHWIRTCLLLIHGEESFRFLYGYLATENFERLLQALESSFTYRVSDATKRKQFDSISQQIRRLYQERNRYVHSLWLFAADNTFVSRMRNLKGFRVEHEMQPDVAVLNKLADDLGAAHKDLLSFINQVFPTFGATPRAVDSTNNDARSR